MAQTTSTITIPKDLTALYEQLKAMLLPDAAKLDYTPRSRAELRAGVEDTLMPSYQASVRERQQSTRRANANIDADAAARGIGASTWGSDVKSRNYGTEAQDIATMRGSLGSTLSSNLNSLMSEQEARKLSADQYNQSAEAAAMSNALQLALANYGKWGTQTTRSRSYGAPDTEPEKDPKPTLLEDTYTKKMQQTDPYFYTRSYDENAKRSYSKRQQALVANYKARGATARTARNFNPKTYKKADR